MEIAYEPTTTDPKFNAMLASAIEVAKLRETGQKVARAGEYNHCLNLGIEIGIFAEVSIEEYEWGWGVTCIRLSAVKGNAYKNTITQMVSIDADPNGDTPTRITWPSGAIWGDTEEVELFSKILSLAAQVANDL